MTGGAGRTSECARDPDVRGGLTWGHMPEWDAEIEVDEALARELIRETYPELGAASLQTLGIGWDNTVWATRDRVAFRFPRREIALAGIAREMKLLPQIAPRLPCAIPDAAYPGSPSSLFPWPWFGSRVVEGRELSECGLDDIARGRLAGELGAYLACLHRLSFRDLDALPVDPLGRADMITRVPRTRAALDELDPSGALTARADAILTMAQTLPPADNLVLAHGDMHVRHVLVDGVGRLTGVIDWGDICRAPASIDISLHWSVFPPPARQSFIAAYGRVDDATLLRARVLALFLSATLASYARAQRMSALEAEALTGVERTFID
jgi:aminoglycoside phosphotransferase (APT) family kinase protein